MRILSRLWAIPAFLFILAIVFLQVARIPEIRDCVFSLAEPTAAKYMPLSQSLGCLSFYDLAAALLLIGSIAWLVYAFVKMESIPRAAILLIVFLAAVLSFYLAPGQVMLGDAGPFSALTRLYQDAFAHGQFPITSFQWSGGSMVFWYYGPLFFAISGFLSFITSDLNLVTKLLLYALHIASAFAVYKLSSGWSGSKFAGVVSALGYALAFEHVGRIAIEGRWPLALVYLLLPLMVMCFESFLSKKKAVRSIILLSLMQAAVILASPADAIFVLLGFWIYAFARLFRQPKRLMLLAISSGILSFGLVAFWALPFLPESAYVNGAARISDLLSFHSIAFDESYHMLAWPGWWGPSGIYYLGISLFALSVFAIFKRREPRLASLAWAAFAGIFVITAISGRMGIVVLFSLSLLAGFGAAEFLKAKLPFSKPKIAAAIILLILIDLAPAAIQPIYANFSYEQKIFDKALPSQDSYFVLDLNSDRRTYYPYVAYTQKAVPVLFGAIPEGEPKSFSYAAAVANGAAIDFYDQNTSFSKEVLDGLYLFNTKYVVLHSSQVGLAPSAVRFSKLVNFGYERGISVIEINASPAIAARKLVSYNETPDFAKVESYFAKPLFESRQLGWDYVSSLISNMKIDKSTNTAGVLFVRAPQAELAGTGKLRLNVTYSEIGHTVAAVGVNLSDDAFVMLPFAYFPSLSVRIDGKETGFYRSAFETVVVQVPKGSNVISISESLSGMKKLGIAISAIFALGIAILFKIFK